ncbi:hypothetical protein [Inquilinus sp. CA228]|uniref:hypothetical protein n=1 Tax=Inquilinus sp. CA228 TaxID=3455609 RepID=UPI003F8D6F15
MAVMVCRTCPDRAACREAEDCAAEPGLVQVAPRRPISAWKWQRSIWAMAGVVLQPWQATVFEALTSGRKLVFQPSRRSSVARQVQAMAFGQGKSLIMGGPEFMGMFGRHATHVVADDVAVPSDPAGATRRSEAAGTP